MLTSPPIFSTHSALLPPLPHVQLLESSEQSEEPTTFEVGAGDIVGNRLFEVGSQCLLLLDLLLRLLLALLLRQRLLFPWPTCTLCCACCAVPAALSLQAFDEAVRGLAVGGATRVKVSSPAGTLSRLGSCGSGANQ